MDLMEVDQTDGNSSHFTEPEPVEDRETSKDDLIMLADTPDVFLTPKKKKSIKVKEQLDDSFCRRSKRISNKL